jgi:hypothetical protein
LREVDPVAAGVDDVRGPWLPRLVIGREPLGRAGVECLAVGRVQVGDEQAEPSGTGGAVVLAVADRVRAVGDLEEEEVG